MKVTALKSQKLNKERVNVYIDGVYLFSLDLSQVISLGVRVGVEYTQEELEHIRQESDFGKLYARTLEYSLMRPRSVYEVQQYLYRKTRPTRSKTGEERPGYSTLSADRVLERIQQRGYVDDERFATFWVENRRLKKGASARLLRSELLAKGVQASVIDWAIEKVGRSEREDLRRMIERKKSRYSDTQKLTQYLIRQGFSYSDVADELSTGGD